MQNFLNQAWNPGPNTTLSLVCRTLNRAVTKFGVFMVIMFARHDERSHRPLEISWVVTRVAWQMCTGVSEKVPAPIFRVEE
jgi:hypothetical protein